MCSEQGILQPTANGVRPPTGPTSEADRIVALDALRGFALLGILVVNIQSFAMIGAAYLNPTAWGDLNGGNYAVWYATHLLADMKFMTIFSLLFGAGILLLADRQTARGRSPAPLHYRRMGWLLLIGLTHAYLFWYGDILVAYACCGMVVYLFRRLPWWILLPLGMATISVASGLSLLSGLSMPYWPEAAVTEFEREEWNPTDEQIAEEIATYRGTWLQQLPARAETAFAMQTFVFLIHFAWRAGGLMLVGMALFRLGLLTAQRSSAVYIVLLTLGLGVGIPAVALGIARNFAADWNVSYSFFLGSQINYWGSLLVSLGFLSAIMLLCKTALLRPVVWPLSKVGQMALTNYLAQTVVCTTLFYGHGFGLFCRLTRVQQACVVAAILVAQLVLSPIWLHYCCFGPCEWLWRSLSYWRRQPLRRRI